MVKKSKTLADSDDNQLAEAVRSSTRQIWQAGLGVFVKAQDEGGKAFAKLVKEGTDVQKRAQKLAEGEAPDVIDTVTKVADRVSKHASGSWDKLEQVFEDRVSRSLASLGVPTHKDIQILTRQIEELSKSVAALSGNKSPTVRKRAATPTAKLKANAAAKKPAARAALKAAKRTSKKSLKLAA